jgi:eukaryotic-like serine/threonine-protein kinase
VSDFQAQMLGQIDTNKAGAELMADVSQRFAAALEQASVPDTERAARAHTLRQELVLVNATDAAAALIDRTILRPAVSAIDERFKDDPATDASLRQSLADLYTSIGLYDAAYPLQESALATRRRVLGEEHEGTLTSISNMGHLLQAQGKLSEAEPFWRETLEKRRRVSGEEHPATLGSVSNMGFLLQAQGKLDQAEPYYRDALEKRRRVLGEEHPDTLQSINIMGFLLRAQDRLEQAEPYYREALEKRRRVLGEEHPSTITSISNMGFLLQAQGKLDQAEPYVREALEKRRRVLGEEHPDTLISINNMGGLFWSQGRLDQTEPYWREVLEMRRRVLGEEHPDTLVSINNMGGLLRLQGKPDQAEPFLREAIEKCRRVLGEGHPYTLGSVALLLRMKLDQGKAREALELAVNHEPATRKALTGGSARGMASFLTDLGLARIGVGFDADRFALAEANLLEAHAIYLAATDRPLTNKDTLKCMRGLIDLYTAWDAAEPVKGHGAKAAEWQAKLPPPGPTSAHPAEEPARKK